MNRIDQLFKTKKDVLNIFLTAGYPNLNDTLKIIKELTDAGVDMIEIGIPFSDPMADGETIQHSSEVALKNGMSLKLLFKQLRGIRQITQIPLVMMGYLNPVLQYGVEKFCISCKEVGIDGVIFPDLPISAYEKKFKTQFEEVGLHNIQLITPQTSDERIREIEQKSSGFIYAVSSASTTGGAVNSNAQQKYFERLQNLNLRLPTLIGFGIHNQDTFETVCQYSNGGIIGSAFVKHLELGKPIVEFIQNIKQQKTVAV